MVQTSELTQIRKAWEAAGSPLCRHENHEREDYLGSDTGDYGCRTCGTSWHRKSGVPEPEGNA